MNWFTRLCRQTGLIVHDIVKPVGPGASQRREVNRTIEEKQVSDKITLRRTTIEEIEVKRDHPDNTP